MSQTAIYLMQTVLGTQTKRMTIPPFRQRIYKYDTRRWNSVKRELIPLNIFDVREGNDENGDFVVLSRLEF